MLETPLGQSAYVLASDERSWLINHQLSMRVLAGSACLDPGRTAGPAGPAGPGSRGAFS